MGRNLLHILLGCMIGATPPTASLIRYTCDVSGARTLSANLVETGNHTDPCCTGEREQDHSLAPCSDCCTTSVFHIPGTSPVPTQVSAHVAPQLSALPVMTAESRVRLAAAHTSPRPPALTRSLPLLV
jgi:hypothetical protein